MIQYIAVHREQCHKLDVKQSLKIRRQKQDRLVDKMYLLLCNSLNKKFLKIPNILLLRLWIIEE